MICVVKSISPVGKDVKPPLRTKLYPTGTALLEAESIGVHIHILVGEREWHNGWICEYMMFSLMFKILDRHSYILGYVFEESIAASDWCRCGVRVSGGRSTPLFPDTKADVEFSIFIAEPQFCFSDYLRGLEQGDPQGTKVFHFTPSYPHAQSSRP